MKIAVDCTVDNHIVINASQIDQVNVFLFIDSYNNSVNVFPIINEIIVNVDIVHQFSLCIEEHVTGSVDCIVYECVAGDCCLIIQIDNPAV